MLRQGLPLPQGRRRLERRESHDAIGRPLSSGSQPHRSKLSRPARVWPRFFSSHNLHLFASSSHRKQSHVRYLTGRSTPQAYECKSPARSRHWRSSTIETIGLSLSNADVDKKLSGKDARKGAPASKPYTRGFSRKNGARGPTFGAVTRSPFQRFTTQNTRLNSTLSRRHVTSGK